MKFFLLACLLLATALHAKPSNIERVDRYIEDRNCKPHIVKTS